MGEPRAGDSAKQESRRNDQGVLLGELNYDKIDIGWEHDPVRKVYGKNESDEARAPSSCTNPAEVLEPFDTSQDPSYTFETPA